MEGKGGYIVGQPRLGDNKRESPLSFLPLVSEGIISREGKKRGQVRERQGRPRLIGIVSAERGLVLLYDYRKKVGKTFSQGDRSLSLSVQP